MADFFQPQQDPDAIRRAMLARLFGGTNVSGQPTGVPPSSMMNPTKSLEIAPSSAPSAAQPGTQGTPGREESSARPPIAPTMSGGQANSTNGAKPMAKPIISTPSTATDASNQPPPALSAPRIQTEEEYTRTHPQPEHTPYVAPDLKHRMLMGLFAGMQEFGHPGAGAATMRDYLGEIPRNEEAERNYPQTSAAAAHKAYMDYAAGAKAPLDLEELQERINLSQAEARRQNALAEAAKNPRTQLQHVVIAGPNGEPIPAAFDRASGRYLNPDTGEPIGDAKAWEKPERPFNLDEQEFQARQTLRNAKTPEEKAAAQARIEDIRASRQRPPEERTPKESRLTPGQKAAESRKYQKALDDIETERRARESGTYVHPRTGELMQPMTNDELFDRKQRAEDEYKDALEAAGETGVRRFNYRTGQYEGGEPTEKAPREKPAAAPMNAGGKPNGKAAPAQHQVGDEVMYQGKRHKITAIQNGKATLQPLGQ